MKFKENTPPPNNKEEVESSAYRSYKRRENNKANSAHATNNTESLENFSRAIEMLNSNKVTKMNAFEYRMIDYIGEIFQGLDRANNESETV